MYNHLSGIYLMMVRYLLMHYNNKKENRYQEELQKQKQLWEFLYNRYSDLLLSTSFSNSMATNSEELLQSAQYALKDYASPEKQYNLTLINNVNLFFKQNKDSLDYKPIQIKINIGDPIAIDTIEYRDQLDDIYYTLAQYLFVTDINYKLRSDGDLQVTVNNLKYQDKLIQSLVKLIR